MGNIWYLIRYLGTIGYPNKFLDIMTLKLCLTCCTFRRKDTMYFPGRIQPHASVSAANSIFFNTFTFIFFNTFTYIFLPFIFHPTATALAPPPVLHLMTL